MACVRLAPGQHNIPATKRVFNCDEQTINRLFHGPLGYEHFEIGVGRNIGVSGTRCSFSRSLDWGIPAGLFPKAWFGVPTSVARSQIPPGRVLCGLPPWSAV